MARYFGLRYRQADESPPILTFVAPADEIRTWAGIPHKTSDFVGGFQRPLSDRFRKIIEFFDEHGNVSPTSIVVAFRPGTCRVTALPKPSEWKRTTFSYEPELVQIDIPDSNIESISTFDLAKRVYLDLNERLRQEPPSSARQDEEDDGQENEEGGASGDVEEELPEETVLEKEWGVDVGKSALHSFADRIKDEASVHQFLADIASTIRDDELLDEADSASGATPVSASEIRARKADDRLRDVLASLVQPAMIVDGQHRVWGASESTQEIPFAICALEDAVWREQVFQFVVINKQARTINSELLASIVNSSLTNSEIFQLEGKLEAAGITTYETKVLRILNDDPDSPFAGLISRGLEEESKKITFKAGISLASRWKRRMNNRDEIFKTLFRPHLPGTTNADKLQEWESRWKDYMFAFWNGIKNLYVHEHLWEPGTQLMYRATLQVLQENFLHSKALAGEEYENPITLREAVTEFYRNVPAGFFHTNWKRTELLTDDGLDVLRDALNAIRVPGTKLASLIKTHTLFTGASTPKAKKKP